MVGKGSAFIVILLVVMGVLPLGARLCANRNGSMLERPNGPRENCGVGSTLERPNSPRENRGVSSTLERPNGPIENCGVSSMLERPNGPRESCGVGSTLERPNSPRGNCVGSSMLERPNSPIENCGGSSMLERPNSPRGNCVGSSMLERPNGPRGNCVGSSMLERPNSPRGDAGPIRTKEEANFRFLFYNVENLFDTRNNPDKEDDEFTPFGPKVWTKTRYYSKLRNIAKAIKSCNINKEFPTFIGLAEVENRTVVEDLINKTILSDANYAIEHKESNDPRGIDVALLYNKQRFKPLHTSFYKLSEFNTRDILYTSGVLDEADTLHIFVCHFPSMLGGEKQSNWKRVSAAKVLRVRVDSLYSISPNCNIIICGDLNGESASAGLVTMRAVSPSADSPNGSLCDMGYYLLSHNEKGSYCYMGVWQTIDHIIVSPAMVRGSNGVQVLNDLQIAKSMFLLEENKKSFGWQPFPTYRGVYYKGGFSDHLPIYQDFTIINRSNP